MDAPEILKTRFGFDAFRPGQKRVIEALLAGDSALAVFPTGGGKSLCYQLPALLLNGVTLVVSPLIALMKDQIDALRALGIAAARIDSSLSQRETLAALDALEAGEIKLLYVAPERFNNERFLAQIKRFPISLFAIDEAHCISEWGHNFRPDYLKLADFARELKVERVLTLTATAPPTVVRDICAAFEIRPENAVVTGFYRPNLALHITACDANERDDLLVERFRSVPQGSAIVYVTLQKTAERVAKLLSTHRIAAEAYHAGMETEERTRVQEWWMRGTANVVVATIAFGMGIDKSDVRTIFHYNLPKSVEGYSQEIGRAGRDGKPAHIEMFACSDDVATLENFVYGDTPASSALQSLMTDLREQPENFDISLYDLSARHDLRPLVLRTALTYLELSGALQQGTPFYAGYELRPFVPIPQAVAHFGGKAGQFVERIFGAAKKGKTWYAINPDTLAAMLGEERKRIIRAVEVMEEKGLVEVKASDVRNRFTWLDTTTPAETFAAQLTEKFQKRETSEITRLGNVLKLIGRKGCQTNALTTYFGEKCAEPCGHCTYCRTQTPIVIKPSHALPMLPAGLDTEALQVLRETHLAALAHPRQLARYLCGLTSPATTRARITRSATFGVWENYRFAEILDWCERNR